MLAKVLRNQEIVSVYVPTTKDESVGDSLRMCNDMKTDLKKHKQRLIQCFCYMNIRIYYISDQKTQNYNWKLLHNKSAE